MLRILVVVGALVAAVGCSGPDGPIESRAASGPPERAEFALAIHGGAGVIEKSMPEAQKAEYIETLEMALRLGRDLLDGGVSSLDTVESVVRVLEDSPLFNAGRGAVFTHDGTNELDAAIMDGSSHDCGSVSGVRSVKNPISLARMVMERSRHVFLSGEGAEAFATANQLEIKPPEYFFVERRFQQLQTALAKEEEVEEQGTVGAVALDRDGNLAAATSTGGMTNKRFGRVGDVPIIGAGTYADNRTAAISCTGIGEQFIRHTVAHDIVALMEYRGLSLQQAATLVIGKKLNAGDGGMIGVSSTGEIALVFNSPGMFRGEADSRGRFEVRIWE